MHEYLSISCVVDAFCHAPSGPGILVIQGRTLEECSVVCVFLLWIQGAMRMVSEQDLVTHWARMWPGDHLRPKRELLPRLIVLDMITVPC